jgi:ribosomal protein S18 acetylase RimI-like enzyme
MILRKDLQNEQMVSIFTHNETLIHQHWFLLQLLEQRKNLLFNQVKTVKMFNMLFVGVVTNTPKNRIRIAQY